VGSGGEEGEDEKAMVKVGNKNEQWEFSCEFYKSTWQVTCENFFIDGSF
jgi:hypothetical protein